MSGESGTYFLRTSVRPYTGRVMVVEANHPLVTGPITERRPCAVCGHVFEPGAPVVLIPLGPGEDPEERTKASLGRFYNAICAVAHARCAGAKT